MGSSLGAREVCMTQQKDLKRRIRERMEKTGESYTAARAHVLRERTVEVAPPPPSPIAEALVPDRGPKIPVVEPRDVTEEAVALGLKCKVLVTDGLAASRALGRLHDVLVTTDDADLEPFRMVALRGRRPVPARWSIEEARKFLARARAGIAGVGPNGWLLAYLVDGELVLASVSLWRGGAPTIWLRRIDHAGVDELALAAITLR
jgi:hypothetical protein